MSFYISLFVNKLCIVYTYTTVCYFFLANDVLLSHMITFLNDKEDKELRGSFFDCIVGVAAYIGWHCSVILTPLLLQVIYIVEIIFSYVIYVLF